MRKFLAFIFVFVLSQFFVTTSLASDSSTYFFYGQGCPHCGIVDQYLEENNYYEKFAIAKKEIYFDRDNAVLFNDLLDQLGVVNQDRGVPTLVVNNQAIVGDKPIIDYFENQAIPTSTPQPVKKEVSTNLTILAVIGASIVDAINPCAFAVLILLVSTILASKGGKKALLAGLAFCVSIFISYLLMGLGLYKALDISGAASAFYKTIGLLAIILGILNLKDYFWYGKGVLMEVPLSWRPKLKSLLASVTSPIGAFGVGFLVSLFLLPCTSGPYIVILGMLAKNTFDTTALVYLILYNLIFVSPMILITLAVYKGFDPAKAEKLRQQNLKRLHLIGGLILLVMGIAIMATTV